MPKNPALKDQVPPHNEEAERAALGAMLIDNEAVTAGISRLQNDDFYSLANGKIFHAIKNLSAKGIRADLISVCDELGRMGELDAAGGEAYVSSITGVVGSAANISYYIDEVRDKAMRRALITIASKITAKSFDISQQTEKIVENAQQFIYELIENRRNFKYHKMNEVISEAIPHLEDLMDKDYTGVRSGFTPIDRLTRGFQKSEMIVIGARPSIGKTAFALNIAANIAFMQNLPVAFFSLEMPVEQLGSRLLASESRIDLKTIRAQLQTDDERNRVLQSIINVAEQHYTKPLFIEAVPNMTLSDLRTQARHIREKERVEIIFIDYLGLIGSENSMTPRWEQVSEISRSLKGLARELEIPIVVLSQLVRVSEGAPPTLAHLRDSGSVEQDADVVMLLHRERTLDTQKYPDRDFFETDIDIAKNRNGPTDKIKLAYKPKFTRFEELTFYEE